MWHVLFCDSFTQHDVFKVHTYSTTCSIFHFLLSNTIIAHGMDIQYCIYLKFGFSHSLAIMNNAVLCQVFGEHIFLIIFVIYSEWDCRIHGNSMLNLLRKKQTIFHSLYSHQWNLRAAIYLHSHQYFLLSVFFITAIWVGVISQWGFYFLFSNEYC